MAFKTKITRTALGPGTNYRREYTVETPIGIGIETNVPKASEAVLTTRATATTGTLTLTTGHGLITGDFADIYWTDGSNKITRHCLLEVTGNAATFESDGDGDVLPAQGEDVIVAEVVYFHAPFKPLDLKLLSAQLVLTDDQSTQQNTALSVSSLEEGPFGAYDTINLPLETNRVMDYDIANLIDENPITFDEVVLLWMVSNSSIVSDGVFKGIILTDYAVEAELERVTETFDADEYEQTFIVPANVFNISLSAISSTGGGCGGGNAVFDGVPGGGSGGGAQAGWESLAVNPGDEITMLIPAGGAGGVPDTIGSASDDLTIELNAVNILTLNPGDPGNVAEGGNGGTKQSGSPEYYFPGGNGHAGNNQGGNGWGGGGGSSGGSAANGTNATGQSGATAPTGGTSGSAGGSANADGVAGAIPGGGAGGGGWYDPGEPTSGGDGSDARIVISYDVEGS